jgi:site-specific recombinase XerD
VPLDKIVIEGLRARRAVSLYTSAEDWIFASYQTFGKMPMWPDSLRRRILQPAARKAGIAVQVGWHTFRHTYSTLLADNGNDVKVVQELMRHAKLSTAMEVYTHARMEKKRVAQRRAVDVLFARQPELEEAAGT